MPPGRLAAAVLQFLPDVKDYYYYYYLASCQGAFC
jgi:hypothetical protein